MGFLAQSGMIYQSPRGSTAIFSDLSRTSFLADICPWLHLCSATPTKECHPRDGRAELPGVLMCWSTTYGTQRST